MTQCEVRKVQPCGLHEVNLKRNLFITLIKTIYNKIDLDIDFSNNKN